MGMSFIFLLAAATGCAGTDGAPAPEDTAPGAEPTEDEGAPPELPNFELEKGPQRDAGPPEEPTAPKPPPGEPEFCPIQLEESGYNNTASHAHVLPTACAHNTMTGSTSRWDADYFRFEVPNGVEVISMTAAGNANFTVYAPGAEIPVQADGETRLPVIAHAEYFVEVKSSAWTATPYELTLHIQP